MRRGRFGITNPEWAADADSYYHRMKEAPDVDIAEPANPKVGELYDHRGRKVRVVRAREEVKFGFQKPELDDKRGLSGADDG